MEVENDNALVHSSSLFATTLFQKSIGEFPSNLNETSIEDLIPLVEKLFKQKVYEINSENTGAPMLAAELMTPNDPQITALREKLFVEFKQVVEEEISDPAPWLMDRMQSWFAIKQVPADPQPFSAEEARDILISPNFLKYLPRLNSFNAALEAVGIARELWKDSEQDATEAEAYIAKTGKAGFRKFCQEKELLMDPIDFEPLEENAVTFEPRVKDASVNPETLKTYQLKVNPLTNQPYERVVEDLETQCKVLAVKNEVLVHFNLSLLSGSKEVNKIGTEAVSLCLFLLYLKNCQKGKERVMTQLEDLRLADRKIYESLYFQHATVASIKSLSPKAFKDKVDEAKKGIRDYEGSLLKAFPLFFDQRAVKQLRYVDQNEAHKILATSRALLGNEASNNNNA